MLVHSSAENQSQNLTLIRGHPICGFFMACPMALETKAFIHPITGYNAQLNEFTTCN